MKSFFKDLKHCMLNANPVFMLLVGLCPAFATTYSVQTGLGMGIATALVLVAGNVLAALFRNMLPTKIRPFAHLLIIALLVTMVDLAMSAYLPELRQRLGIFVPLITVNCLVLRRAGTVAACNTAWYSFKDGVCAGTGFIGALLIISVFRELLGSNSVWGITVFPAVKPAAIMLIAPGAFLTFGIMLALINLAAAHRKGGGNGR